MTNPKYNCCEIHTTLNSIERIEELSFECGLQTGSYFQMMCLLESLQSLILKHKVCSQLLPSGENVAIALCKV